MCMCICVWSLFGPNHVINIQKVGFTAPSPKVLALWDAVPKLIEGKDAAANASHTASWKSLEAQVSLPKYWGIENLEILDPSKCH